MAEQTSGVVRAASFSPADFAFVSTRDPDFIRSREALLMGGRGNNVIKGVTNVIAPLSSYSLLMHARSGVYGPSVDAIQGGSGTILPQGLYTFSSQDPMNGIRAVSAQNVGGLGGMTARDNYYILRMIPVPNEGPQESTNAEGQSAPALFSPRPHTMVRGSAQNTLTISSWGIDNILSAIPGSNVKPGGAWLEAYVAAWQSLATPHPILGRKPYLALKFGPRWWGVGSTALTLQSIEVSRDYYEKGVLAHATLNLRFEEISV